ncbi:MAG TPA: M28 family peptidase [Ktedonobacteraceae bacterium]
MKSRDGQVLWRARFLRTACIVLVLGWNVLFALAGSSLARASRVATSLDNASFPIVDPLYIYNQLHYLTTSFQRREAGYVADQGHDRFASYWAQEMARNLQGFAPQIVRDTFAVQGWRGRPASLPAFNMEVSVPGLTHPEQEVILGCHYDGEIDSSASAFDDTSGCAYELGVGQAMGSYWRAHQLYPARTIRFVIFDAEEQGVFGSFHYLNHTINGDLANITAMFNQEQSGINYPARFLGRQANPFMPDYINLTPLQDNAAYAGRIHLSVTQRQHVVTFRNLWSQAIPAVFAQFRAEGYSSLDYYNTQRQNEMQPIFSASQETNLHIRDDPSSNSDQVPFIYAGLPVAMLTGDQSYYDRQPEPWAYPYDLPQDTLALMNTYAGGSSRMSPALALALALPAMLTTWMLAQPAVSGAVVADGKPLATLSDVGQTVAGQPLTLHASGFDPAQSSAALAYAWDFGDGSTAGGSDVTHTYRATGTYQLTLTATSSGGKRVLQKTLHIGFSPLTYTNPYSPLSGKNTLNPSVKIPAADDTLPPPAPLLAPFANVSASSTPQATTSALATLPPVLSVQPSGSANSTLPPFWPLILGLIFLVPGVGVVIGLVIMRRRRGSR